jgi:tRNA-2-methylthio-N6-dimethylallyladenosine synthase
MNELDSELVKGHLSALGYRFTADRRSADIVLYNTCSVREQAENKVLSRIGRVGTAKARGDAVILGVIGCMAERYGPAMLAKYPQIDLMCGPGELDKLPVLIDNATKTRAVEVADRVALQGTRTRRSATLAAAADSLELLDLSRSFDPEPRRGPRASAYVRITRGCNKFCTYCVVPYTRGPEVHRPPDRIVDECKRLADAGVIEVTLLGQTVNHYLYTHGAAVMVNGAETPQVGPGTAAFRGRGPSQGATGPGAPGSARAIAQRGQNPPHSALAGKPPVAPPLRRSTGGRTTSFADLLARIHEQVPAIRRLRFVTSYPRDFGDDILAVMAACPRICRYLHVPAQSGSNRILALMNRGYTVEQYEAFIERARRALPDVCIAGDVIVGFPTETEADFELTRDLLRRVRFKNNFIFKYSPRPGTAAERRLPSDVPEAVKRRRNNDLLALQAQIGAEVHAAYVGRVMEVFVERVSRGSPAAGGSVGRVELGWERRGPRVQMSGRTGGDLITVFDLPPGRRPEDFLGRIVLVRIVGSGPLLLRGEVVGRESGGTGAGPDGVVGAATRGAGL